MSNKPLCTTCSAIDFLDLFSRTSKHQNQYALGNLSSLSARADSCTFCQFAAFTIRNHWNISPVGTTIEGDQVECTLCSSSAISHPAHEARDLFRIALAISTPKLTFREENAVWIHLDANDADKVETTGPFGTTGKHFYYGQRLLDPQANIEVLKGWLERCTEIHGKYPLPTSARDAPVDVKDTIPTVIRLVDVHRMCIVNVWDHACEYVTLSYVWGTVEMFRTTKQVLSDLEKPGGLDMGVLPATIQDAITLVRELGVDYIWIDTLCIVQDDDEDKKKQIHRMNSIFEGASLMIAAAAGTVSAGLPGIGGRPRTMSQVSTAVKGVRLMVAMDVKGDFPPWSDRGWTFQEWLMSRRIVVFTAEQFHYGCRVGRVWENLVDETDVVSTSHTSLGNSAPAARGFMPHFEPFNEFHGFKDYYEYVEEYTKRALTYESDALDAFEGVIGHLMEAYDGDFYYGLPVRFFEHALLWQPKVTVKRRLFTAEGASEPMFPSWSWSGWLGGISSYDIPRKDDLVVESLASNERNAETQYYRASNMLQTKLTNKSPRAPSWTKTHYRSNDDYCLSVDTTTAILPINVETPFSSPATNPTTETVGNWLSRTFTYTILDTVGIPCGLIPITDQECFDTEVKQKGKGEFIRLSRTRRLPSWAMASKSGETFKAYRSGHEMLFVNVMLVVYDGHGYGRRVGVGQVWSDFWEKCCDGRRMVVLK